MQHAEHTAPECRGRLRTDGEGRYGFRAIVPVPYAIPDDVGPKLLYCNVPFCVGDSWQYRRAAQFIDCFYP